MKVPDGKPSPAGWRLAMLGEVADVIMGQSPASKYYNARGVGLPFFQGKAEFGDLYPRPKKWCDKPLKIAEKGDVLISVRAPVGPTNLAAEKCCIGRGLAAIRAKDGVDGDFIFYYLRATEADIAARGVGTTFAAISGGVVRSLPIPIPPLAEQKRRIVRLQNRLARLDCAKAALDAAEKKTVQFKSAFLKSVFPDPTKPPPTGWRKMSLGEVAEVFNGKTPPRAEQRPAGFPVLKIRDIAADGQFRGAFQSFVDDDYARQFPTQQIRENDILILNAAHTSTHVASKMCRAAPPFLGALATGEWTIIRPQTAKISPLYLHYFIASDTARLAVKQMVRGVHLYPKDVRTLELSLPLASKQERIAIKCEDFLSRLNRVHAKVKRVAEDTQKLQSHSTQAVFLA